MEKNKFTIKQEAILLTTPYESIVKEWKENYKNELDNYGFQRQKNKIIDDHLKRMEEINIKLNKLILDGKVLSDKEFEDKVNNKEIDIDNAENLLIENESKKNKYYFEEQGFYNKYNNTKDFYEINEYFRKKYNIVRGKDYIEYRQLIGSIFKQKNIDIEGLNLICEKLNLSGENPSTLRIILSYGNYIENHIVNEDILYKLETLGFTNKLIIDSIVKTNTKLKSRK